MASVSSDADPTPGPLPALWDVQVTDLLGKYTDMRSMPAGNAEGLRIVQTLVAPPAGFAGPAFDARARPHLTSAADVTLPLALMCLDPIQYPSVSRARKAIRKREWLVCPDRQDPEAVDWSSVATASCETRVRPGEVLAKQVPMGAGATRRPPPVPIPVIYEDDHMAVVNKPAGYAMYSKKGGGYGYMTLKSDLPYVLCPPAPGTPEVLRRPHAAHRLDRATCGLVVVAKTRPALVALSRAFAQRRVKKTYQAIVVGDTPEPMIDSAGGKDWHTIDLPLGGKAAHTKWRVLAAGESRRASTLAWLELRPETGRFHQLRLHLAQALGCPICGDTLREEAATDAPHFRKRGMFLCATALEMPHPVLDAAALGSAGRTHPSEGAASVSVHADADGAVQLSIAIPPPLKFTYLFQREVACGPGRP